MPLYPNLEMDPYRLQLWSTWLMDSKLSHIECRSAWQKTILLDVRPTDNVQKVWPGFEPGSSDYASDILGQLNYLTLYINRQSYYTALPLDSLVCPITSQNCSSTSRRENIFSMFGASCNYSNTELHPPSRGRRESNPRQITKHR